MRRRHHDYLMEARYVICTIQCGIRNQGNVIALFDHEEVGSGSAAGAGSPIMHDAVVRISEALTGGNGEGSELFKVALSKSLIFSIDMAHAVHPNYASKHESRLSPKMNHGVVIKSNANQKYATNGIYV